MKSIIGCAARPSNALLDKVCCIFNFNVWCLKKKFIISYFITICCAILKIRIILNIYYTIVNNCYNLPHLILFNLIFIQFWIFLKVMFSVFKSTLLPLRLSFFKLIANCDMYKKRLLETFTLREVSNQSHIELYSGWWLLTLHFTPDPFSIWPWTNFRSFNPPIWSQPKS